MNIQDIYYISGKDTQINNINNVLTKKLHLKMVFFFTELHFF